MAKALNLFISLVLVSVFIFPRLRATPGPGALVGVVGPCCHCLCLPPSRWEMGTLLTLRIHSSSLMQLLFWVSPVLLLLRALSPESWTLEFLLFLSMLIHGEVDWSSGGGGERAFVADVILEALQLSGEVLVKDLGVQSEARAFTGEQGEVIVTGEAGFGGEGFARSVVGLPSTGETGFSGEGFTRSVVGLSSTGETGRGDLHDDECFFSL